MIMIKMQSQKCQTFLGRRDDIYMERTTATKLLIKDTLNFSVPLGSIPELPAISCREIEASEGKYNISNKHWLDSSLTGQAELVDCSDSVKGEF